MSARPTGGLPFYSSPLPHYRPMASGGSLGGSRSGGGGWWCRWVVSASRKYPILSRDPSLFLWSSLFAALKSAKRVAFRRSATPYFARNPLLFSPIVRHPQASHNKPIPDSLFRIHPKPSARSRIPETSPFLAVIPILP